MKAAAQIPIFIIGLERDAERRTRMTRQLEGLTAFVPRFVRAVPGGTLPDSVCFTLCRHHDWSRNHKGAIGCFLSHVGVWEQVGVLSEPFAIVLEDDVDIARLPSVRELEIPDDADIVFLNTNMSPETGNVRPATCPIHLSLLRIDRAPRKGAGSCGYLLTPGGAGKLITACATDLYYGHVDGRLLRYSVTESDIACLPDDSELRQIIRKHHHPQIHPALGILKAYSVSPALKRIPVILKHSLHA